MRIAIDARAFSWTGIGRYIRNLLRGLAHHGTDHTYVVIAREREIGQVKQILGVSGERFELRPVESSYYSWREQTKLLWQLNKIQADLFHFTHFNVPLLFQKPYVVTIHDTTRFVFPGQKRQRLLEQVGYELVFAKTVERAQAVICVSNTTREELFRLPICVSGQVLVIREGIDDIFFRPASREQRQKVRMLLGTQDPFLLYVGVWMGHKNMSRLLASFEIVKRAHPGLQLVVTGKPVPGYINVVELARRMGIASHVIFPGFVSHELLSALYAEAECFVFPSLYEGFGLPPLEAAACGTPVVTSNVSSLPEAMGDAAQYVNPESVEDIVRGILRVLTDAERREALVRMGMQRARQFRWADAVKKHVEIYQTSVRCKM